jgi:hypothetical protein
MKNEELRMKGVCDVSPKINAKRYCPNFAAACLKIREPISFFIIHYSLF